MEQFHGGDWAGYQEKYGVIPLDFSINVSPLGVPETVKKAVAVVLDQCDRYPDPKCRMLRDHLAQRHRLSAEYILCGNGAADLIFRLVLAKGAKRALVTAPTFVEYQRALDQTRCQVRHFFLDEHLEFQVTEDVLKEITPELDLMFLCQPNNPTGQLISGDLMIKILKKCTACGTLLVVDECFHEFLPQPEEYLVDMVPQWDHLLIIRAFTKSYAMAGLRLGYALCSDTELLKHMEDCGQLWPVSIPAQAAGLAALEDNAYLDKLRELIKKQRPLLAHGLEHLGCKVISGTANYLLFYCADQELGYKLEKKGILIRDCSTFHGLGKGWYRVCVKAEEDNQSLLTMMEEVLHNG